MNRFIRSFFSIARDRFIKHQINLKYVHQFIKEVIFSIGLKESTFFHSRAATNTCIKTKKSHSDNFRTDNHTDFDMQLDSFFDKFLHQVLFYLELFSRSRTIDRAKNHFISTISFDIKIPAYGTLHTCR